MRIYLFCYHVANYGFIFVDLEILTAAKNEIAELGELIRGKQFRVALPRIDKLINALGSNFRDLNIMRVECLLELKRPEDAYNLTNSMVGYLIIPSSCCL